MKYLCLVYGDEIASDALPAADVDAFKDEIVFHREDLRHSGRLIVAGSLRPTDGVATVGGQCSSSGFLSVGPHATAPADLDGFYLIEAADLNDAIRLAAAIPLARQGSVEVRPVKELESWSG